MQQTNDVYEHILQSHSVDWKFVIGSTKKISAQKINIMSDAHDPYELEANAMGGNIQVENAKTKFDGKENQGTSPDIATTIRSLKVELQSSWDENKRVIKALEEQNQLTASIL